MDDFQSFFSQFKPGPRTVAQPTYCQDIVGEIRQVDERDIVFARSDLYRVSGEGSSGFQEYYAQHPEWLDIDIKTNRMPGLGRTGDIDSPMMDAQFAAIQSLRHFGSAENAKNEPGTSIIPYRAAQKIKTLARFMGADLVRIGPLRQEWVYSHIGRAASGQVGKPIDLTHHTHAIAMGFRMDHDLIQHAPDFPVLLATAKGYATGAWVAVQLAQYVRMLGFSSRAHYDGNYLVQCVPVAVDCGMGELSRAGFLLTKELGLGLRLAIVTTNMDLEHDQPVDIGVQSFCEKCRICAELCPIGAIPKGERIEVNGTKRWKLDAEKCYRYWHAVGTDCGVCMAACPWTKKPTWLHRRMADLATIKGPHQGWMVAAEKAVYGRFKSKNRPSFIEDNPKWRHLLLR